MTPSAARYAEQLRETVGALRLQGDGAFEWMGERFEVGLPAATSAAVRRLARSQLLTDVLYLGWYTEGTARPLRPPAPVTGDAARFEAALLRAAGTRSHAADGWALGRRDGRALGLRDGLAFDVTGAVRRGRVREPGVRRGAVPGWLSLHGASAPAQGEWVRVYWHLAAAWAPRWVRALQATLGKDRLPFTAKVLQAPERYGRADAAVLWLAASDWERARPPLARLHARVAPGLSPQVPALTHLLAPGVGLAEDTGGASFGLERCGRVAAGLLDAQARGLRGQAAIIGHLEQWLREAGVAPERPYLRAADRPRDYGRLTAPKQRRAPRVQATSPLDAVLMIAARLANTALGDGETCTWLAPVAEQKVSLGEGASRRTTRWRTLGPTLYDGAAGVALFLAAVGAYTREQRHLTLAVRAASAALAQVAEVRDGERLGFYTGIPGIAAACVVVGRAAGDEGLSRAGRRLLATLDEPSPRGLSSPALSSGGAASRPLYDLIAGEAGAIVGALIVGGPRALAQANRWAGVLAAGARRGRGGALWWPSASPRRRPWTGLAHGTTGIAYALAGLHARTGEARWAALAAAALRFEADSFDEAERTWADLRFSTERGNSAFFSNQWCHGAAGMLVGHSAMLHLVGDVERARDALAFEGVAASVAAWAREPGAPLSLCHGLAGNLDAMELGAASFAGPPGSRGHALAADATAAALRRLIDVVSEAPRATWAAAELAHPSLMTGAAGLGMALLRAAEPRSPSPLAPLSFA